MPRPGTLQPLGGRRNLATTSTGEVRLVSARGVITPEQRRMINQILEARWFLVRNGGVTPRARCGRCKRYHPYITLGCVEKPHNGLGEVVGLIEREQEIGTRRGRIGHGQHKEVPRTRAIVPPASPERSRTKTTTPEPSGVVVPMSSLPQCRPETRADHLFPGMSES